MKPQPKPNPAKQSKPLVAKADYEADWRRAEKAYRENPSAKTFAELHAARQSLRKTEAMKSL